jgi:antirestriction protein ArdC
MNDLLHSRGDIYRTITGSIIEAIEAGAGNFTMPWHGNGAATAKPENALTHAQYQGVNTLMLWVSAHNHDYATGYWASYRQWQRLGAQVEKGARATPIVFYKQLEDESENEEKQALRLLARSSSVFNAAQVKGWTPPEDRHPKSDVGLSTEVAGFIDLTRADIVWGGSSAHYHIATDRIYMPDRERFRDTPGASAEHGLHSTVLHELVHWSGAKHRLNRFEEGLRSDDVPFEELIAEIGAAFLCADLGISVAPRPDHAAYVAHWLATLKGNNKAIFQASRQATKATQHLHALVSALP